MSLTLHMHPLSSFCWKALIGLYENGVAFEPCIVNLGEPQARAAFLGLWPIGKFPLLRDAAAGRTVPESTIVLEYVDRTYPGAIELVPRDFESALRVREIDRFYDLNVHVPMQKAVTDKLRPAGMNDPFGVEQAKGAIRIAYGVLEAQMADRTWAAGEAFTLADCAAAPALYYADKVVPLSPTYPTLARYLARLVERPSFARVLREAQPYFALFPG